MLVLISDCVLIFRNWSKRIKVAKENPEEKTKVIEACSPSETDKNVIRHEVRYKKTQKKLRNCHSNTLINFNFNLK